MRAVYRKVHLFDVAVSKEVSTHESASIAPGDVLVAVELPEFVLGMSICFDLRFPELYRALAAAGAQVLVVPAAFREVTGRAHWDALVRARAIENHAYVVAAAQRGVAGGNVAMHGHSMIVDPWGAVLAELPDGDGVIVAEVDAAEVEKRRGQIPVLAARRTDVYARPVRVYGTDGPAQTDVSGAPRRRTSGVRRVDQARGRREEAATAEGEGGGRLVAGARGSQRVPGRGSEVVQLLPRTPRARHRQNDAGRSPSVTVRVFVDEPWTIVSFTVSPDLWELMMPASWSMLVRAVPSMAVMMSPPVT